MKPKSLLPVLVALLAFAAGAGAQYPNAPGIAPAAAQAGPPAQPKGMVSRGLVSSLGPIPSVAVAIPAALTGQVVELAPGGHTGKIRNVVPSFLYVVEGTLAINTEGGPIGVSGIQYHAEGQSYAGPTGLWYTVSNAGDKPARYLVLFVGAPGAKTMEEAKPED
jgi:hypothetical protein